MPWFRNITVGNRVAVADGASRNLLQKNLQNGQGRQLGDKGNLAFDL